MASMEDYSKAQQLAAECNRLASELVSNYKEKFTEVFDDMDAVTKKLGSSDVWSKEQGSDNQHIGELNKAIESSDEYVKNINEYINKIGQPDVKVSLQ